MKPMAPRNEARIKEVKQLRQHKKLSYREIADLLDEDLKQVWLWDHYKLSPDVDKEKMV